MSKPWWIFRHNHTVGSTHNYPRQTPGFLLDGIMSPPQALLHEKCYDTQMKTHLDHLPEGKQNTLAEIRRLILNEVEHYVEQKASKNQRQIIWLVLFGSYARGDYVTNPINGYISDFDFLVAVNGIDLANDLRLWHGIEDKIERLTRAPINLIVHTHEEIDHWLKEGHYFFSDIRKDGIYLYSSSGKPMPEPKNLTNAERLPIAEKHFAQWFESASEFVIDSKNCFKRGNYKKASFELHQATERFYACLLLVKSNYRPKTHNLKNLRHMSIDITKTDTNKTDAKVDLSEIFPGKDRFQRRCFERLKRAYVESRYSEHFDITQEELEWLYGRVEQLKKSVKVVCEETIESLRA